MAGIIRPSSLRVTGPGARSLDRRAARDVDYDLPPEAIAQDPGRASRRRPAADRRGRRARPRHGRIPDLAALVGPGDVVVVNTTRVLPARLQTAPSHRRRRRGAAARAARRRARALGGLVRPSRKVAPGPRSPSADDLAVVVRGGPRRGTTRSSSWCWPRRPSCSRCSSATATCRCRPTSRRPAGSRALPDDLRRASRRRSRRRPPGSTSPRPSSTTCARPGRGWCRSSWSSGLGTFRPIATEQVEEHHMHGERYTVPEATHGGLPGGGARRGRRHHDGAGPRVGRGDRAARRPHRAVHPRRPTVRSWSTPC